MNGLFVLLFLLALVGLIIGLIKPTIFKNIFNSKSTRSYIAKVFGILIIIFLILVGVTTPKPIKSTNIDIKSTVTAKSSSPVITTKTVTSAQPIAFSTSTVQDSSLAKGSTSVKTKGVNGVQTKTYTDTYTNGKETSSKLVSTVVTTPPVDEVIDQGTYVAPAAAPATPATTQTTTTTPTCYPLTNEGGCYEPGEYCRDSDQGTSGVAGDGESITCEDNDGWRWEPN